jgi:hypothetical protein
MLGVFVSWTGVLCPVPGGQRATGPLKCPKENRQAQKDPEDAAEEA